jgi:hypothetical protein
MHFTLTTADAKDELELLFASLLSPLLEELSSTELDDGESSDPLPLQFARIIVRTKLAKTLMLYFCMHTDKPFVEGLPS